MVAMPPSPMVLPRRYAPRRGPPPTSLRSRIIEATDPRATNTAITSAPNTTPKAIFR
jgi:hypothetical protein